MKYTLITLIAGILALTSAYALTCGPGQDLPCPSSCEVDYGEGNLYPEYCPTFAGSCNNFRVDLGQDWCGNNGEICVPPGVLSAQAQCCTPTDYNTACTNRCGQTISDGCGRVHTCTACAPAQCTGSNVGSVCWPGGGGIGSQYYCGLNSRCAGCAAGYTWNGNACVNDCAAGENPAIDPGACKLTIPPAGAAYRWQTASATFDQMKCGESGNTAIGEGGTVRMSCTSLEAGPLGTHHCNDGANIDNGNANDGYCCPDGQYWNSATGLCQGSAECYSAPCPYTPSDSRYFTTAACVSSSGGACCSVGPKYGMNTYYDYSTADGVSNFRIY